MAFLLLMSSVVKGIGLLSRHLIIITGTTRFMIKIITQTQSDQVLVEVLKNNITK